MPARQTSENTWEMKEDVWAKELMPIPDLFNDGQEGFNFNTDKGCLLDFSCDKVQQFLKNIDEGHIWTLIEGDGEETYTGDDGEERPYMYIVSGYHHVNRMGYFVTCVSLEEYLGQGHNGHTITIRLEA